MKEKREVTKSEDFIHFLFYMHIFFVFLLLFLKKLFCFISIKHHINNVYMYLHVCIKRHTPEEQVVPASIRTRVLLYHQ
jgi:hypothetical protein